MASLSRHKARNCTGGGFLALAPCWHHHCQQPPQQQEWDGVSQGRWHFAGILWAAAVLGSKARETRSRLPLLPHRQAHTVLAVRGGCFGAIITPALQEAPLSSFSPTCRCMYRPNHRVWLCFGKMFHLFFPAPDLHPLVLWVPPPLFQVPPALPTPGACRCSIP